MGKLLPMRGLLIGSFMLLCAFNEARSLAAGLRAGAAVVDITPREMPVIVNGGFLSREVRIIVDRLHCRTIALSSNGEIVVIAVVDNCMIPTGLCDEAKRLAAAAAQPPGRVRWLSPTPERCPMQPWLDQAGAAMVSRKISVLGVFGEDS